MVSRSQTPPVTTRGSGRSGSPELGRMTSRSTSALSPKGSSHANRAVRSSPVSRLAVVRIAPCCSPSCPRANSRLRPPRPRILPDEPDEPADQGQDGQADPADPADPGGADPADPGAGGGGDEPTTQPPPEGAPFLERLAQVLLNGIQYGGGIGICAVGLSLVLRGTRLIKRSEEGRGGKTRRAA